MFTHPCVQPLRMQLKMTGIHESWSSLRSTLSNQLRLTARMLCKDGRTVPMRFDAEVGGAAQLISSTAKTINSTVQKN